MSMESLVWKQSDITSKTKLTSLNSLKSFCKNLLQCLFARSCPKCSDLLISKSTVEPMYILLFLILSIRYTVYFIISLITEDRKTGRYVGWQNQVTPPLKGITFICTPITSDEVRIVYVSADMRHKFWKVFNVI